MKLIKFLLIILTTITFSSLNGQTLEISFSPGVSASWVKYQDKTAWQAVKTHIRPRVGYIVNIGAEYFFSPVLSLRTVTAYTQKGFAYQYTYRQGWKRFNYLCVNTLANIYLISHPQLSISFYLGGYGGYWLSGYKLEADYRNNQLLGEKINLTDTTFSYNRLDAGPSAGLYLKYWQTYNQAVTLELGLQYSTVSNDRRNVAGTLNRSVLLLLGYVWVIK